MAAVVAAAAAFGVLTVGCGEDDPVLESPGTEDPEVDAEVEGQDGVEVEGQDGVEVEGQDGADAEGEEDGHGQDHGEEGHEHD